MKRGEVWWADLSEPQGRRPVVLISRNEAYSKRLQVTIAPLTTRIRNLPVEVFIGVSDGVPKDCVVNLDMITTVEKQFLLKKICELSDDKIHEINKAIYFALGLDE